MELTKDTYLTIENASEGEFKDRGSKFIAYAFPMNDTETFDAEILQLKKLHLKSRHHCFAYRYNFEEPVFRYSDDGEPSGTAGKPIYGQIIKQDLYNVGIIVVRYFGGTKLGTGGLINAYKNAAAEALQNANIISYQITELYDLVFDYARMGEIMEIVKLMELNITSKEFNEVPVLKIEIPKAQSKEKIRILKSKILKVDLEYVDDETEISGIEIKLYYAND